MTSTNSQNQKHEIDLNLLDALEAYSEQPLAPVPAPRTRAQAASQAFSEAFALLEAMEEAAAQEAPCLQGAPCRHVDHEAICISLAAFWRGTVWEEGRPRIQEDPYGEDLLLGNCPECDSTLSFALRPTETA